MVHFSPNILTRKIYVLFLLQSGSTGIPFVITPENSVKAGDFLRCQQQSSWWWMRARSWDQIGWHMEVGEGGKSVRTGKCKGASPASSALPRACPHSAHISWLQLLAAAATHIFWGFVLQGRNKIQLVLAKCKHFHPDGNNLKCCVRNCQGKRGGFQSSAKDRKQGSSGTDFRDAYLFRQKTMQ